MRECESVVMDLAGSVQLRRKVAEVTKRELVVSVADQLGFTQNEVSDVVQTTLDTITEALASRDRLEIRNFGVFEVKVRDARQGRNPRTGDSVPIAQKHIPIFKPGKALKEWVEKADVTAQPPSVADGDDGGDPTSGGVAF